MPKDPNERRADAIIVRKASQHNLKSVDVDLALGLMTVITGVSGSGKSSLAFDTIYAEGQRRYAETFSPYARQFLDRLDKPDVDRIEGIPPAIAIDQTNPVRTSRSTVGTMTELNDYLKLLFARTASLYCPSCGHEVKEETPESVATAILEALRPGTLVQVVFRVPVPDNLPAETVERALARQGFTRFYKKTATYRDVIQDRVKVNKKNRSRLVEGLESAFHFGRGQLWVIGESGSGERKLAFSSGLHCAECDRSFRSPVPNMFSFNSPLGACEHCRGFGRTIGVDYGLVIPDESLSLQDGAIRPWQSGGYQECQRDLMRAARRVGVPVAKAWSALSESEQQWVIEGDGKWEDGAWYGVAGFFEWMESKSYKMHIRVLLSRYRAYHLCAQCQGARLKPESLWWRVGKTDRMNLRDVMLLPLGRCREYFEEDAAFREGGAASDSLLREIRSRLRFLCEAGLTYLTLDRQSRTLSGGEVQRINLTTALGTTLVNTLFVLDEPSIGLHARDSARLIQILHRLRDVGNTLLVVEHDPDMIMAADRVIDMGPGAGEAGGAVVYHGEAPNLVKCRESLTGAYLSGRRTVLDQSYTWLPSVDERHPMLRLRGGEEHNLKQVDVDIPLGRMVCVCGVSGSGKSTLVEDCLYRGLMKQKGLPTESPGRFGMIEGADEIDEVHFVNQQSIGKTTRSNVISYVGGWSAIRSALAATPLARKRGYKPGSFSFNSGMRCPGCSGNGFVHVEMQFLSDVYLRCPDCDGSRFLPEILDVQLRSDDGVAHNVTEILSMTVTEACSFFAGNLKVRQALDCLLRVGLGYVRLGQTVPTLSGGESQRLKLAAHLGTGSRVHGKGHLFILDEPTTGLHFADVAVLLHALRDLVLAGHTVLVVEHHLDVIRASDWCVELGPEGGGNGGEVVFQGAPRGLVKCPGSATGEALQKQSDSNRAFFTPQRRVAEARERWQADDHIELVKVHEHNLKGVTVKIPRNGFSVITGLSGSGKSTLAFDVLYHEGQRRYLDSLNAYARQFVQPASRPDVEAVIGVPPTVAIEQRVSRGGLKSTVATVTEIYHYLRLLYAKLGVQYCPDCQVPIMPQPVEVIHRQIMSDFNGRTIEILVPLVKGRKGIYKDLAAWAAKQGVSKLRVDGEYMATEPWPVLDRYKEHNIEMPIARIAVHEGNAAAVMHALDEGLSTGDDAVMVFDVKSRRKKTNVPVLFSTERSCPKCGLSFPELEPRMFSFNSKRGWCSACYGTGLEIETFDEEQTGEESNWIDSRETPPDSFGVCRVCEGQRLNPIAMNVRLQGRGVHEVLRASVKEAIALFEAMTWSATEALIAKDVQEEILERLAFLDASGLGYLTLDRSAPTLSGGESQRIRLASQLGSNLRGVCYVLDEPTIGLHPDDNRRLLASLRNLQQKGNTIVVVEHDEETIRQADHVIDLGPGAGEEGGEVVAAGSPDALMAVAASLTGQYLTSPMRHPVAGARRSCAPRAVPGFLRIERARLHNLKALDVAIPLGRLVVVTGASGSGKSTMVHDVLYRSLRDEGQRVWGCERIKGRELIDRIREVDQSPIGRTPRSCPATYIGLWNDIRALFAETPEARMRGYTASRFSFNTGAGRCAVCKGNGYQKIEMHFLPDVRELCEACQGRRFTEETCEVRYKGLSIADVLDMPVAEALGVFSAHPRIQEALALMCDVGLGYLRLGQQSPTLSGGEAQRIKLVSEWLKNRSDRTGLYILDEPTIGLHSHDVLNLIHVLQRLVDAGHSVLVIEHNLDVIAEADHIIDLGPGGGIDGGSVVALGTPNQLARMKKSRTGVCLREHLDRSGGSDSG